MVRMTPSKYAEFYIEVEGDLAFHALNFVDVANNEVGFLVRDGFQNVPYNSDGYVAIMREPKKTVKVLRLGEVMELNPEGGQGWYKDFMSMMYLNGFVKRPSRVFNFDGDIDSPKVNDVTDLIDDKELDF